MTSKSERGCWLRGQCYACGHRLAYESTACPQCGEEFHGRTVKIKDTCDCERCVAARLGPGFEPCPECGNLAMNPLPSCSTCGTEDLAQEGQELHDKIDRLEAEVNRWRILANDTSPKLLQAKADLDARLARCTALEAEKAELATVVGAALVYATLDSERGEKPETEPDHAITATIWKLVQERGKAESRCTALEQERDQLELKLEAQEARIDEVGVLHKRLLAGKREAESRCQHLEQAVRSIANSSCCGCCQEAANVAKAALFPSQDETPGTDENRVSFAAGYSTALDDVLKDRKP